MDNELLKLLSDPLNQEVPLNPADKDVLARINGLIAKGKVKNREGKNLDTPVTDALIDALGKHLYIVENNIPILLANKAIALETLAD